jgi:hypothetical protein
LTRKRKRTFQKGYSNETEEPIDSATAAQLSAKKLKKSADLVQHHQHEFANMHQPLSGSNSLANTYNVASSSGNKISVQPTSIITASSWRAGELIAQKHLKQLDHASVATLSNEYQQHHQQSTKSATAPSNHVSSSHRSSSAPINPQPSSKQTSCSAAAASAQLASKKQKKTSSIQDYHLVAPTASDRNKIVGVKVNSPQSASKQANSNKLSSNKPYDLTDLHQYMKNQKLKRLYEINSEKERQRLQEDERKRKLSELYQKQRQQAALAAANGNAVSSTSPAVQQQQPPPPISSRTKQSTQAKPSGSNSNNNSNNNNSSGNSSNNKLQAHDQDISKVLMDRITYLLSDNDKLVEKQRRKYLKPTQNGDDSDNVINFFFNYIIMLTSEF